MDKNQQQSILSEIRNKTEQDPDIITFKKSVLGGFDKKEVLDYINLLKGNLQKVEKNFKDKVEECESSITFYNREKDSLLKKLDEKNKKYVEYEEEIAKLKLDLKNMEDEKAEILNELSEAKKNSYDPTELEKIMSDNKKLTEYTNEKDLEIYKLKTDSKILKEQAEDLKSELEKTKSKAKDLQDLVRALKISKENILVNTNMKIYENIEIQKSNIEKLNNSFSDALKFITIIKNDFETIFDKCKVEIEKE